MTGSIFQTQKIPSNNSNFKAVQSVIIKEGRQTDDVEKPENLNESAQQHENEVKLEESKEEQGLNKNDDDSENQDQ